MINKEMEKGIRAIITHIGEDPDRSGITETPKRVIKSWKELYSGYNKNPEDLLKTFESDSADQIVLLKNIEMYSMCEHHMLPFYGHAHVAYIPNTTGEVIGISKLARLVDIYARRMQIQERIGDQVTKALMQHLKPEAAACIINAKHMCMCARGVGKQNSVMTTSSMRGAFFTNRAARQELMDLINTSS